MTQPWYSSGIAGNAYTSAVRLDHGGFYRYSSSANLIDIESATRRLHVCRCMQPGGPQAAIEDMLALIELK